MKICFSVFVPDNLNYRKQFLTFKDNFKKFYSLDDLYVFSENIRDEIFNNIKNISFSKCSYEDLKFKFLETSDYYDVKIVLELDCIPYGKIENYNFKNFSVGSPFNKLTTKWVKEHIELFKPYLNFANFGYECPMCYCKTGFEEDYKNYINKKYNDYLKLNIPEDIVNNAAREIFGDDEKIEFKKLSLQGETSLFSNKLRHHCDKLENLKLKLIG